MGAIENNKPLVSVIVPSFNHAYFICETLDCVLGQIYENWECIVVDDGSADNTNAIVNKYTSSDLRFRYFHQKNKGLPSARNYGIRHAKGEFIQLLDADDLITKDKLAVQLMAFFQNPGVDIVYSEYLCFSDEDQDNIWTYSRVRLNGNPANDIAGQWEKELSIPIHCFLYRKTCFERWGLLDKGFMFGKEDWDLHLKFAINGAKFCFVQGQTAKYRVSEGSMVRRNPKKMARGKAMIFKKYIFSLKSNFEIRKIFLRRYFDEYIFTKKHLRKTKRIFKHISKFINKYV